MTKRELIEALEEYGNDETEVRLAHQPRWAFEYSISEVVSAPVGCKACGDQEDGLKCGDCDGEGETVMIGDVEGKTVKCPSCGGEGFIQCFHDDADEIIYIGEGSQIGYLPQTAAESLGWK